MSFNTKQKVRVLILIFILLTFDVTSQIITTTIKIYRFIIITKKFECEPQQFIT